MFLVDTNQGRIISDEELKQQMASEHPYQEWLERNMVLLEDLPVPDSGPVSEPLTIIQRQQAFGYTYEDLRMILGPMAENGVEPLGSMGDDTPLAVLSNKPQPFISYFRQLFAQVTNPPIDAIREEIVTGTEILLGSESNLLDTTPEDAHQIKVSVPIISNDDVARLRHINLPGFSITARYRSFSRYVRVSRDWKRVLEQLCEQASTAVAEGVNLIILSDRGIDRQNAAIPALLATSGLHHHLTREGTRTRVSLNSRIRRAA